MQLYLQAQSLEQLAHITQIMAISSTSVPTVVDLHALLSQIDNPHLYYFTLSRDSPLVKEFTSLGLPIMLVNQDSKQLMTKYLVDNTNQSINGPINNVQNETLIKASFECSQLALFASGRQRFNGTIHTSNDHSLVYCSLKMKMHAPHISDCQIFLCDREPCLQSQQRKSLITQLRQYTHSISQDRHWCQFTTTNCLGHCSPGGTAMIHQHHSLALPPLKLRFIEHLSLPQWQSIIDALHLRRPLTDSIATSLINGAK
ncbi:hypothetical protein [Shewanella youngdeokensis]|uniref:Uncharacterized protein n=1 Tax=Shewanella youngdeokensis TaxID=2999068 RepID=A0ABZ0K4D7_9GAMM|nr:hypothetical protein RGE70_08505 [Shewanella sp. DAU334]